MRLSPSAPLPSAMALTLPDQSPRDSPLTCPSNYVCSAVSQGLLKCRPKELPSMKGGGPLDTASFDLLSSLEIAQLLVHHFPQNVHESLCKLPRNVDTAVPGMQPYAMKNAVMHSSTKVYRYRAMPTLLEHENSNLGRPLGAAFEIIGIQLIMASGMLSNRTFWCAAPSR